MRMHHPKLAAAASLVLLLAATGAAQAVVLWDQSNWNTVGDGSVNLVSSSCSQISGNTKVHTFMDVHFDTPVVLQKITIYETDGNVRAATNAYLNIIPKTGPTPAVRSDSLELTINRVPIVCSTNPVGITTGNNAGVYEVSTKNALNRSLPAGDYWISLSPIHSLGLFPYTIHLYASTPVQGDPTCAIVNCSVNSQYLYPLDPNQPDYTIKVEGDLPTPTTNSSWGSLKTIYR